MLQCFLSRVRLHFHQALTVLEKIRKVATGVTGKELRKNRAEQGFFRSASPPLGPPCPQPGFPRFGELSHKRNKESYIKIHEGFKTLR